MLRRCFEVLVGCALPWIAPWLIQASSSFGDAGYRAASDTGAPVPALRPTGAATRGNHSADRRRC
jgi:hypothetical protein